MEYHDPNYIYFFCIFTNEGIKYSFQSNLGINGFCSVCERVKRDYIILKILDIKEIANKYWIKLFVSS